MPPIEGRLEFEDVYFHYEENKPVLKGISFVADPGTVIALVGSSGSGKSTLAGLAATFLEPVEGRVLVDGTDVALVKSGSGSVSGDGTGRYKRTIDLNPAGASGGKGSGNIDGTDVALVKAHGGRSCAGAP